MSLRLWRFSSIMSTAVTLTAAFGHLMEWPAKMTYDRELYVRLHRTLYPNFGRIAGSAEIVAVLTTAAFAWRLRREGSSAFPLTAAAAGCLAAAHVAFWLRVHPANVTMASWPLDDIPSDWERWRDQWESTHALRAFLVLGALGALAASTPQEDNQPKQLTA